MIGTRDSGLYISVSLPNARQPVLLFLGHLAKFAFAVRSFLSARTIFSIHEPAETVWPVLDSQLLGQPACLSPDLSQFRQLQS